MSLKVHIMGPRSDKFPYKAIDSFFIKIDNKTYEYLKRRMIEHNETLENAIINTIRDGVSIMKEELI